MLLPCFRMESLMEKSKGHVETEEYGYFMLSFTYVLQKYYKNFPPCLSLTICQKNCKNIVLLFDIPINLRLKLYFMLSINIKSKSDKIYDFKNISMQL